MKKEILTQYIDACELVKDTEKDIERLRKKKKRIVQDSVRGSNSEFPFEQKHFKIQGSDFTLDDDSGLRREEELLETRKKEAEKLKNEVEEWMNSIPQRMQRIIRYKIFEDLTWQQVAQKIGRKATKDSVRMELDNFLKN